MAIYIPANKSLWIGGRVDSVSDKSQYRFNQVIVPIDINNFNAKPNEKAVCIIGYATDTGILANKGRGGASSAPMTVRMKMSSLPYNFDNDVTIYDAGNIYSDEEGTASTQKVLGEIVKKVKDNGWLPICIGGGHDICYGTYQGLRAHYKNEDIGIINIDAHFDNRDIVDGPNSGNAFSYIYNDCMENNNKFLCHAIGIQRFSNTRYLHDKAIDMGITYTKAREFTSYSFKNVEKEVHDFIDNTKASHITVCCDVFKSPFSDGTSAPIPLGIDPNLTNELIRQMWQTGKISSIDFAEVNPVYDKSETTTRMVALMIYEIINNYSKEGVK